MRVRSVVGLAAAVAAFSGVAGAGTIPYGTYNLANHPDGAIAPPKYGLRLDGLFNATPSSDRFTFDFDDALSHMVMSVVNDGTKDVITIWGESFGGRDVGSNYANDSYKGVYEIFFQYTIDVGMVGGDDDRDVKDTAHLENFGYIIAPTGERVNLADYAMGGRTFRVGDENNDQGHRGFDGMSGWGWLAIEQGQLGSGNFVRSPESGSDDWLFTVVVPMPAPALLAVASLGGLGLIRRRPLD